MSSSKFPVLAPGCVLRKLESPYVYNTAEDQLYELDNEAFGLLKKCNGKTPLPELPAIAGKEGKESLEYMINEGIIRMDAGVRKIKTGQSPVPSLRYLLLNITSECNLACRHCYLGSGSHKHIKPHVFGKAISQFEDMGGLKLMISGGEPLIHPEFMKLLEMLASCELRVVVLSNGTLIDRMTALELAEYVDEVQVSIDGIASHDLLRGKGSYDKAMRGISALISAGIPVSIATMIHKYNTGEFGEMQKLFSELGVISWSVDVPGVTGNLLLNRDYIADTKEAARYLKYGFGAGGHESTGDYSCGSHLCAVSPDGMVSKCGFFENEPAGTIDDLRSAWEELCSKYLFTLDRLECRECKLIHECRGGCRFRAKQYKGILAPDPVLCYANGIMSYL